MNESFQSFVESMERLQLMLNRATNPINEELDIAALDAFISILTENDETLGLPATKLLVLKIHSNNVKEALLALDVSIVKCILIVADFNFVSLLCFSLWRNAWRIVDHGSDKRSASLSS